MKSAVSMKAIKALAGTYTLVLQAVDNRSLEIGKLGRLAVRPGWYLYVGSALGQGGVKGRVERHHKNNKRLHWHIDYLRKAAQVVEVWICYCPERLEHQWAGIFRQLKGAEVPLKGFGASDCNCQAHLFFFESPPSINELQKTPNFQWQVERIPRT
jgi:Uri superfamily endonuclease